MNWKWKYYLQFQIFYIYSFYCKLWFNYLNYHIFLIFCYSYGWNDFLWLDRFLISTWLVSLGFIFFREFWFAGSSKLKWFFLFKLDGVWVISLTRGSMNPLQMQEKSEILVDKISFISRKLFFKIGFWNDSWSLQ